jgi:hypothetical protein
MKKFFEFVLRLLGIKKTQTQPKVVPSPAKVEEVKHQEAKLETPTWVNPEPFKAEEKVSILDEVVSEISKVEEEKKEE